MAAAQPRSERIKPATALREIARAERFDVLLRFESAAEASRYLCALTSLLFGASTKVTATLTTGVPREDLTAAEIADRLARACVTKLRFALRLGGRAIAVEPALMGSEPGAVAIDMPFTRGPATARLWLQSDVDVVAPIAALALPTTAEAFAIDAAHALVGLALRCGGFEHAELTGDHPLSWNTTKSNDAARPVRSTLGDAVWSTATSEGRGFRVCPDCGRSEPEYGPGFTATKLMKKGAPTSHHHPLERGKVCAGIADGPFYLGHEFPTDALLLRLRVTAPVQIGAATTTGLITRASRMALSSLVEALGLAASRTLQIDEGELSGWWTPVMGGRPDEAQLYLYDLLPGGAGYARAVGNDLPEVLDAAETLLAGCDCPSSCYRCIRHYGNNWIHASLDRHLALALLRHLRTGELPTLTDQDKDRVLVALRQLIALRGIACEENANLGGTRVPLTIQLPSSRVCVDVHHPLIDPLAHESPVVAAARSQFLETVSLDAFDLLHDLPAAVGRLRLPNGP